MINLINSVLAIVVLMASCLCQAGSSPYQVGVYYYPGWKDGTGFTSFDKPWQPIKTYPEREPLIGWYAEGDDAVTKQQLGQMREYGIDYVAADTYWEFGKPQLNHWLESYKRVVKGNPAALNVKFELMWANHGQSPTSIEDWHNMVTYWLDQYLTHPLYRQTALGPVVMVFSMTDLDARAKALGFKSSDLIMYAKSLAKKKGLPGIDFVAGSGPGKELQDETLRDDYTGTSYYNAHTDFNGILSTSYNQLDQDYQLHRDWMGLNAKQVTYTVPATSGWDMRPWREVGAVSKHDLSISTPDMFESHLRSIKSFIDTHRELTQGNVVICCWNEFGEGSYIEPTKKQGFRYVETVKRVFKNQ